MDVTHLEIQKSRSNRIRVVSGPYKLAQRVDVRRWYATDGGDYAPSPNGVSLTVDEARQVAQALLDAADAMIDEVA